MNQERRKREFDFRSTLNHQLNFGGKGIRTPDFQLAKLALYQLSYAPETNGRW